MSVRRGQMDGWGLYLSINLNNSANITLLRKFITLSSSPFAIYLSASTAFVI